jgi:hypothetical protein
MQRKDFKMKPESQDQRVSLKWEWWLSCSLLALSIILAAGVFFYSDLFRSIKHPACTFPKFTEISFFAAYIPLITSTTGVILVACMAHWGAIGRRLSFWRFICLITVILIALTLAGVFLPWLPNSCEYNSL